MLKLFKGVALLATVAVLSACGQNSLSDAFKNVSISNVDQDGNAVVTLKTEVGGENIIFSAASLPIVDPKTGKNYGTISMERTIEGKNVLSISANVSGIKLGNVLADNKLPNGANVPIAGLASLVAVPAGKSSRVYLGTTTAGDTLVVGAAIAIQEFDSLANYIQGASVFFDLSQTNSNIKGLGGFFTSTESGKSGIAIFAQTKMPAGLPIPSVSTKALASTSTDVKFIKKNPTTEQANYFGYFANRWSKKKTPLKMK